jgi:hypothetical protein
LSEKADKMHYWVKQLKEGNKITISSVGNHIDGRIYWGDRLVIVPLSASVKAGDLVYCKSEFWTRVRILVGIRNGRFFVKDSPQHKPKEVKFTDIYGEVYEIIKPVKPDYQEHIRPDFIGYAYDDDF